MAIGREHRGSGDAREESTSPHSLYAMTSEQPRRRIARPPLPAGAQTVATLALGACIVLIFSARDHQADFLVFYRAAVQLTHGTSPYPPLDSRLVYDGSAYVYPIWVAVVLMPFTLVGPLLAAKIWVVASYFMYALSLRLVGARAPQILMAVSLATPVLISIQMGTMTPLLALGVALSWRWRNSPLFAAVPAAVAGTSKLYLLVFMVFFAATRRYRALVFGAAFSSALLGAGFLLGPLGLHQYFQLILALAKHEAPAGWSSSGLLAAITGARSAHLLVPAATLAGAAALVWRRSTAPDDRRAFAGALGLSLFATPILWSSYLPLLLLAFLVLDAPAWLVAISALFSWALVTPDRAGAALDAVGIGALSLVAVSAIRSSALSARAISIARSSFVMWARRNTSSLTTVIAILVVEALWALAEPRFLPALVTQDLVTASIFWSASGSGQSENPKPAPVPSSA